MNLSRNILFLFFIIIHLFIPFMCLLVYIVVSVISTVILFSISFF